jgi:hypothetical protein
MRWWRSSGISGARPVFAQSGLAQAQTQQTLGLEDAENLGASEALGLSDALGITEKNT